MIVLLGRHAIGSLRGLRDLMVPSDARETLARVNKTSKVAKGVTSKSRLAIVAGRGELLVIREHRMRAETAGLTGMSFAGW